ncbi:probable beta-1,4-xylosyltransferase IRX14H [Olea europaea subsp. europaea]|uniref:Probable beta-1,4-xylosyltransferase IRX14H n=1 Tax=Olea europaea subsp. europaea TaxID=158383 RepID=A0A8S0RJX9_OLEEU|nr:probable beta-1,4-xylosyltransferase IRX14H [Olea europaea subsp. europaea]
MKQLTALQQQARRSNSFRSASLPLDTSVDGAIKSPATIFWLVLHGLCCLISLVLGFRFSRLVFFLFFSTSSPSATTNLYSALHTRLPSSITTSPPAVNGTAVAVDGGSRVVVYVKMLLFVLRHLLFNVTEPQHRAKSTSVSDATFRFYCQIIWAEVMGKLEGMESSNLEHLWPQLVQGFKDLSTRLKVAAKNSAGLQGGNAQAHQAKGTANIIESSR